MEILVVDNASTDRTPALLQEFNDERLKIYRNEVNIGAEGNFSKAVQLARGEYIALFHADDIYLPEMVEKQVAAFREYPSVGAVFTLAYHINSRGEIIGESHFPIELNNAEIHSFHDIFESTLKNMNFLMCPSAMVRSNLYKELMPFNVEEFRTSADLDMWLRILETHPIVILQEKLMNYRFSFDHGSYQIACLRTERADFFEVTEYYLSKNNITVSAETLKKYELAKNLDLSRCAINYLLKNGSLEAKRLFEQTFKADIFWGVVSQSRCVGAYKAHRVLAVWLFAVISIILLKMGLGRCLAASMKRFKRLILKGGLLRK